MLYGYTVCTLQDDSYTLTTAFHRGNAFFHALKSEAIIRTRKQPNDKVLTYAYIPHLLYVKAQHYKQLSRLQHGLIFDEIAPKKRLMCVLEPLESGKFAPYTYKSATRYTKDFLQPTLYEPLDDQLMQLHTWFYRAPLTEHEEFIAWPKVIEQITHHELQAITNKDLLAHIIKSPFTVNPLPLQHVVLDLRKYAQSASYITDTVEGLQQPVGTGTELFINGIAHSNALVVTEQTMQQLLQQPFLTVEPNLQAQRHLEEALQFNTGPFANQLLVIGDPYHIEAWLHVDAAAFLQLHKPLAAYTALATTKVRTKTQALPYTTKQQPLLYGIIDPFAHTAQAIVKRGEIALQTTLPHAWIDSATGPFMLQQFVVCQSTVTIAENVVLFHPQDFIRQREKIVHYTEDKLLQHLPTFAEQQPPIQQSVYYDTLQHFTGETAPVAMVTQPHESPQTNFYAMLATANIHLNAAQQQAVEAIEGPVMILAGAGSGKTTTLISRIAYMIEEQAIAPQQILLVTFTKKAAQEMKERLLKLPNGRYYSQLTVGTYHAICLRILREQGREFQLLASEAAKHFRFKMILKKLGLTQDYTPEGVIGIISNWKNRMLRPSDIKKQAQQATNDAEKKELIALFNVYNLYEQEKESRNELDFDDFLLEVYYLLTYDPAVCTYYQQRFRYVLCDEFQDVSTVQYELTRLLAAPEHHLCIVGDDGQTIVRP